MLEKLFAVYWAVLLAFYVAGTYEPNRLTIGLAFVQSAFLFLALSDKEAK